MAVNSGDNVAIDIEKSISAIKDVSMLPKCCIFKTPIVLRRLNVEAYVPDAFSIGPFHHGDPKFSATKNIKIKYLQGLCSGSHIPKEIRLGNLTNSIMDLEKEARECYAGPIHYEPNDFVRILVIDGCFIIEFLRKYCYEDLGEKDDPIFTMSCMQEFLFHDLILLENQVPWMVLELLFNKTKGPEDSHPLFLLAINFFSIIFSLPPPHIHSTCIEDVKHLPNLIRKWVIATSIKKVQESAGWDFRQWQPITSATSLVEAGIKFKSGKSQSILDIKFDKDKGILEIPHLLIQETTETTLWNLISFEQRYPDCEPMPYSWTASLTVPRTQKYSARKRFLITG